jgi:hypothetical protein
MRVVYEVRTVERVMRTYLVEFDSIEEDESEDAVRAEEMVQCGDVHKFTEGDAEIEEVLGVIRQ